jgi:hypothetical protein
MPLMGLSLSDAKQLLSCEKEIVGAVWKERTNDHKVATRICYESRLKLDGVLPRGLWLRVVAFPQFPDKATLQMDCEQPGTKTNVTMYRLEWRPLSGHTNGMDGKPEEFAGWYFAPGDTHEHCCLDHAVPTEDRIKVGGVHFARPITPDFQNFAQVLSHACVRLNIKNVGIIPKPGDQQSLF